MEYPAGEKIWEFYNNKHGELAFIMTSKSSREYYFVYELQDGKFVKLGRGQNPRELEKKFIDCKL